MRNVLFVADDLGMSDSVNAAIFHAHLHGALDGAALMMGQPATEAAVARARDLSSLEIGWHLHLVDSRPCTVDRWPWGRSPALAGFALGFSRRMRALVRDEIRAQWDAFCATGLRCRFISGHHHLHVHPFVRTVLAETLPSDFDGWIRWGEPRFFEARASKLLYRLLHGLFQAPEYWRFPVSTTLWGLDRIEAMNAAEIAAVLPSLGEGLHEFMFHPRCLERDADTECLVALRGARA
ncbi:MAG TPA: ChbG/HpnK family deacetylase [Gammaproteobacteria bacterium]|nr:ChbG/HpnK family deacetylase [Gammaproteobacteria bacterium]